MKKKLEALSAQGSLLDSSAGALRRQNAELSKALEEKEAACRELGDRLAALQVGAGVRLTMGMRVSWLVGSDGCLRFGCCSVW